MKKPLIFWFTGLSGAGKTTIVGRTVEILLKQGKKIEILDGDVIRQYVNKHLGFSPDDIRENNRIIANLCIEDQGKSDYIFVPIISPFKDSRDKARALIGHSFHLIYCKISLEGAIRRDAKGLYKIALAGEKENLIGVDPRVPYEPPDDADLILDTETESIEICVDRLIKFIGHNAVKKIIYS